jgi:hypothetical protein
MVVLVMMLIAVGVVVLVMRAASVQGGPNPAARPARPPRAAGPTRPLAPDDDPDFLRELQRRARRDDGAAS